MASNVTINPKYLKYNKSEVEEILDNVKSIATEADVRSIVTDYGDSSSSE